MNKNEVDSKTILIAMKKLILIHSAFKAQYFNIVINFKQAKNKQLVMNDGLDLMGELRKHRMATKGKFGVKRPPFNGQEIARIEKLRDELVRMSDEITITVYYYSVIFTFM